jgi:hypothetical protein
MHISFPCFLLPPSLGWKSLAYIVGGSFLGVSTFNSLRILNNLSNPIPWVSQEIKSVKAEFDLDSYKKSKLIGLRQSIKSLNPIKNQTYV